MRLSLDTPEIFVAIRHAALEWQKDRERERKRGHATLCGSWFFKITIRQISHFATFLKNVVLALEWAAREREESRGGRVVRLIEGRARVCPLFDASLCVVLKCRHHVQFPNGSTWNFTVSQFHFRFSRFSCSCSSIVFLPFYLSGFLLSLLISFYCVARIALSLEASVHNSLFYGENHPQFSIFLRFC